MNSPAGKRYTASFLCFLFSTSLFYSRPASKDKSAKPPGSHVYEDNDELAESLQCLFFRFQGQTIQGPSASSLSQLWKPGTQTPRQPLAWVSTSTQPLNKLLLSVLLEASMTRWDPSWFQIYIFFAFAYFRRISFVTNVPSPCAFVTPLLQFEMIS